MISILIEVDLPTEYNNMHLMDSVDFSHMYKLFVIAPNHNWVAPSICHAQLIQEKLMKCSSCSGFFLWEP